jgi:hypothetical protein
MVANLRLAAQAKYFVKLLYGKSGRLCQSQ